MNIKRIIHNKTVKNAGWLIGGRVINKVLAFVVGVLTSNYLGPSNYGLVNYAAAYTTFFASVCTLGINSVIIKNFLDHPEEVGQTIGTTLVLRAISSALSAVMIVGIVLVIDQKEPVTILVVALSSVGLIFQIFDSFNQWFQYRLQSKYVAIATTIAYVAVSVYKVVLLIMGKSVAWFALATSVDYIVLALVLIIAYKRNGGARMSFSMKKAKELLGESHSFVLSGLMIAIYASTDKLMLKQMLDENAVGCYSVAVSLATVWTFIMHAIIDSMYPSVIQSYRGVCAEFERKNKQMYAVVIYMSFLVAGAICLLAGPAVRILYNPDYGMAVGPLRIVVWYTVFSYLGVARDAWIVCEGKQRLLKYIYAGAAGLNIIMNWFFIPIWGARGAALASLITQFSTVMILPLLIKPLRHNVKLMLEAFFLKGVL